MEENFIEGAGCGLMTNLMDPPSIVSAIEWLLTHPDEAEAIGKRGQEAARKLYNIIGNMKQKCLLIFTRGC